MRHFLVLLIIGLFAFGSLQAGAQGYYEHGVKLYNQGNVKAALPYFEAAAQTNSDASYYQGLCYQRLGDMASARRVWRSTSFQFPHSPASHAAYTALRQLEAAYPMPTKEVSAGGAKKDAQSETMPDVVEVPFARLASGHIIVPCAVNGKRVDMMFDTGAADCFFKQEDFEKMGLKVPQGTRKRYIGVGGEITATIVPVRLSVGGLTRSVNVSVQDGSYQRSDASVDPTSYPLLGENFFGDLVYQIDSNNDVIKFLKTSAKVGGEKVSFKRERNNLVVVVKVNGRECPMILDTGADTVCFSDKHLAALGINRPTDANAGYSGGVGGRRHSYSFFVDSIKLGSVERKNVRACVALDSTMDMPLLGASFLKGLVLTFDPSNNVVTVSP